MNPRFQAESEKWMLWPPRVIESGRKMAAGFDEEKKEKRKKEELLLCRRWVWVDFLSSMLWCHLSMHRVRWWGCLFHWEGWISGVACHLWKVNGLQNGLQWCQREVWCTGRRVRAPAPSPEAHHIWAVIVARMSYVKSELTSVWEIWLEPFECSQLNTQKRIEAGEEILMVSSVKSCRKV